MYLFWVVFSMHIGDVCKGGAMQRVTLCVRFATRRSAVITSIDVSNSRPFGAWLREQNGNDSSNS
nr:hypothetical protein Iba_chr12aCG7840 [Ipomoea batatas]